MTVAASCAPAPTPVATSNTPAAAPPPYSRTGAAPRASGGALTRINGDILTLTTSQGSVTVRISADNITIQNLTAGTLSDLHEGQYLNVMGTQDAGGIIMATSIMIRPQGQGSAKAPPEGSTPWNHSSPRSGSPRTGGPQRGATGTITRIDGNALALTTPQGTAAVITISDNTTIQNFTAGVVADLHEGQILNVMGPRDANGNITVTSIIIQPQGQGAPLVPSPGL